MVMSIAPAQISIQGDKATKATKGDSRQEIGKGAPVRQKCRLKREIRELKPKPGDLLLRKNQFFSPLNPFRLFHE
jgi:hypothetical protein